MATEVRLWWGDWDQGCPIGEREKITLNRLEAYLEHYTNEIKRMVAIARKLEKQGFKLKIWGGEDLSITATHKQNVKVVGIKPQTGYCPIHNNTFVVHILTAEDLVNEQVECEAWEKANPEEAARIESAVKRAKKAAKK